MTYNISIDKVEYRGWVIEFNSPIEFSVDIEFDETGPLEWHIATIEGFEGYSVVFAASEEDLRFHWIPEMLVNEITYPLNKSQMDEDYLMFYNYLINSVEQLAWIPPETIRILQRHGEGVLLEFKG